MFLKNSAIKRLYLANYFLPIIAVHGFYVVLGHFMNNCIGIGLIIDDWIFVDAILDESATNAPIKTWTFGVLRSPFSITIMEISSKCFFITVFYTNHLQKSLIYYHTTQLKITIDENIKSKNYPCNRTPSLFFKSPDNSMTTSSYF